MVVVSAEFDDNSEEKNLLFSWRLSLKCSRSSLRITRDDSIIFLKTRGAAGLTSSSVEMAPKGSLGIELE